MIVIRPSTPAEAIELQKTMAGQVRIEPLSASPKIIAAIDIGHIGSPRRPTHQAAGIVVCDLEKLELIERHAIIRPITFPYIPGLLSFREAPAAIEVIERVKTPVDVYLIDGQGLAHPRYCSINRLSAVRKADSSVSPNENYRLREGLL